MRVSPGPRTRTWSPVSAATSELVVPRSMPTIRLLILISRYHSFHRRSTGHFYLRRPEYLSVPFVARSVYFEHGAFGDRVRFFAVNGVHAARVEGQPGALDLARVRIGEGLVEAFESQFVSFRQGL